ncbi:MAG: PAC2 family protein [Candidatus Omnitrophica bacterium]|nr:PAC2 family protein [Candidatus Omnitrophota bacterium]
MEGVKILKRPKLKNPYLIVAWPGMGEVAFKAASFLVDKLKAEEFAQIPPEEFFYLTGSVIQAGMLDVPQLPESKFYYWKNPATKRSGSTKDFGGKSEGHDLIIFISNAQPDLTKAEAYSQRIIALAKYFKVETIVGFASMPQPIDHTQDAGVWLVTTAQELKNELKKYNLRILSEGQISGMNGLFLGIAKREGLKGFCLLGEIPLYTIQIENPKASFAVLSALSKITEVKIDFSTLIEQAHVMEGEINKLLDYLKLGGQVQSGPIGEEEIERIKKTLSQLTKLPGSVKEKIEKLFEQSKADITKASSLKLELDKWNIYKEYEDRFLDLFRKPKEKGN